MQSPIVEMKHISKAFPGVYALIDVDFVLMPGSVHGLVGENGAGKSTLMKILSGTYASYEGDVYYQGKKVTFANEHEALSAGISIVPQELSFVPELTVEENIFLGREQSYGFGLLNKKARHERAREMIQAFDLNIDPMARMIELSVAQRQMVEIIKAISRNAKIVIMDEPTSALTDIEVKQLFEHIHLLKQQGVSIIYISHKLEEIFELCDTITVLRDARLVKSMPVDTVDVRKIIAMMVGREMEDIYPPLRQHFSEEAFRVEHCTRRGVFSDISFSVKKGEILGVSGMMGAGRSEIMRAVFGIDRRDGGEIYVDGKKVRVNSPQDAIRAGIGMVTEDRAIYGFVGLMSVKDNVTLPNGDLYAPMGLLKKDIIHREVTSISNRLAIRIPNINELVMNLSGGNQQKVVLAKWLVRSMKVLIIDEPTRGIDVGAKQEIYRLIQDLASEGLAVIVVSSEMQEVIGLSHRIIVVDSGRIVGEFTHENVSQSAIMQSIIEGGGRT